MGTGMLGSGSSSTALIAVKWSAQIAMASKSAAAQRLPLPLCCAAAGRAAADRPMLMATEAKT